jgi:carbon monoxide dehydrogenase subunit G
MVVRAERVVEVAAPPEVVWEFISDPERRSSPISVVDDFERVTDTSAIWHVKLPIPVTDRTIAIETDETHRDEPNHVEFEGRSKVLKVVGEHILAPHEGGTRLTNRFTVDGKLPGVEKYFKRQMDPELANLEGALYSYLESVEDADSTQDSNAPDSV